jgi:hypothetical protein
MHFILRPGMPPFKVQRKKVHHAKLASHGRVKITNLVTFLTLAGVLRITSRVRNRFLGEIRAQERSPRILAILGDIS